eukprot:scaffold60038_cov30-Tisochrysis_lutea.AAC.1
MPALEAQNARPASMATMPQSDSHTFFAHCPGHNVLENGLVGQKWLDVPYFGPPVLPAIRYAGQPKTRWRMSCRAPYGPLPIEREAARSFSPPACSVTPSPLTTMGTWVSPSAPWPHSCASTHRPVAAVPVTREYAIHTGVIARVSGMARPIATRAA